MNITPIITGKLSNRGIVDKLKGRNIFPKVIGITGKFLIRGTTPEKEDDIFIVIAMFLRSR